MDNKKELCCNKCGNDNIEFQVWADELNLVTGSMDTNINWCGDCQETTGSIFKEDYKQEIIK